MRQPTADQERVLSSAARIRLVRAAPGSGKTWLVAEAIRRELERWESRASGIAALSFTRVGGDEIRGAIGHDLSHPHYVGTIDAFLYRYVVRPHLRGVWPKFAQPRLVPGEWATELIWSKLGEGRWGKPGERHTISPFSCVWVETSKPKDVPKYSNPRAGQLRDLTSEELALMLEAKQYLWEEAGLLTHSDVAYLAARILGHKVHGADICASLTRRFPLIVVDELQDTGCFMSMGIQSLLAQPSVRGLLVGDPDQAIYEFSGASPETFESFKKMTGVMELALSRTMRCPRPVAVAASAMKSGGDHLAPAPEITGRAILVHYSQFEIDIPRVVAVAQDARKGMLVKVVARQNKTVYALAGGANDDPPSLHCRPTLLMHRAVRSFRQGRSIAALAAASTAIGQLIFKREGLTDEVLAGLGVDAQEWSAMAKRCLLRAANLPTNVTSWDWQNSALRMLWEEAEPFCSSSGRTPKFGAAKPQKREGYDHEASRYIGDRDAPRGLLQGVAAQTIHAVKGETHDVTIFVCPPTKQDKKCPSVLWWPVAGSSEDQRIAYVGMTRSRMDLVLCVHQSTLEALKAKRPEFVARFRTTDVSGLASELAAPAA